MAAPPVPYGARGMSAKSRIVVFLAVAVIWSAYWYLMKLFWVYYPSVNPLFQWTLDNLIAEHPRLFHVLLYSHDLFVNVLVALPVAILFRKAFSQGVWPAVLCSTLLLVVWDYRSIFWGEGSGLGLFDSFGAFFGLAVSLGLLPLAYFLAGYRRHSGTT